MACLLIILQCQEPFRILTKNSSTFPHQVQLSAFLIQDKCVKLATYYTALCGPTQLLWPTVLYCSFLQLAQLSFTWLTNARFTTGKPCSDKVALLHSAWHFSFGFLHNRWYSITLYTVHDWSNCFTLTVPLSQTPVGENKHWLFPKEADGTYSNLLLKLPVAVVDIPTLHNFWQGDVWINLPQAKSCIVWLAYTKYSVSPIWISVLIQDPIDHVTIFFLLTC